MFDSIISSFEGIADSLGGAVDSLSRTMAGAERILGDNGDVAQITEKVNALTTQVSELVTDVQQSFDEIISNFNAFFHQAGVVFWILAGIFAASGIAFACCSASLLKKKGYSKRGAFAIFAFFFGIPAMLYAMGAPQKEAPAAIPEQCAAI